MKWGQKLHEESYNIHYFVKDCQRHEIKETGVIMNYERLEMNRSLENLFLEELILNTEDTPHPLFYPKPLTPTPNQKIPPHSLDFYHLKKKAIPLQNWTGPEVSRRLKLPDFKTIST
jgi:hypothetical protein